MVRDLQKRARIQQALVHAHQRDGVPAMRIGDVLGGEPPHQNHALDGDCAQVLRHARLIMQALDSHLLAYRDGAAEGTAEGVEAPLGGRQHRLRDMRHEIPLVLARLNEIIRLVVHRPVVEVLPEYFCATLGEGTLGTVMDNNVSAALIHICILCFINDLPVNILPSRFNQMPNIPLICSHFSFWSYVIEHINWLIGVKMTWQK